MVLCNLHTHTERSDGIGSAEDVIRIALEKGFRTLGFSDHVYTPWGTDYTLPEDPDGYIRENLQLGRSMSAISTISAPDTVCRYLTVICL